MAKAVSTFIPNRAAGLVQMERFIALGSAGVAYENGRNFDRSIHEVVDLKLTSHASDFSNVSVSMLSPYIRHRLIIESEVLQAALKRESIQSAEKFIQEICWRTYNRRIRASQSKIVERRCIANTTSNIDRPATT